MADYRQNFNSKDYLKRYYSTAKGSEEENYDTYFNERFHDIFNMDFNGVDWLLDVGTGPCMHTTFYSSRKFKNIVLSDYSASNRNELTKWLECQDDAHDWLDFLKYIASQEDNKFENIEKRTRDAVKAVLPIDVHIRNPIDPIWFQKFDCILTNLCLEAASLNLHTYTTSIGNLKTLLKPNGYFIIGGVLEETFYVVDDIKWYTCKLEMGDICKSLETNNFKILYKDSIKLERVEFETSDCTGMFVIVAQLL